MNLSTVSTTVTYRVILTDRSLGDSFPVGEFDTMDEARDVVSSYRRRAEYAQDNCLSWHVEKVTTATETLDF